MAHHEERVAVREAQPPLLRDAQVPRRDAVLPPGLRRTSRGVSRPWQGGPSSAAALKGGYFADLFGGKGGVGRAINDLGFTSKAWEILHGPDSDLTRLPVQRRICRDMRQGLVLGLMLAPPCCSFSIARDRTMVIRTRAQPWGLPNLPEHEQQKVEYGNECLKAALRFIKCAHQLGLPWVLENPFTSRMWWTPELQALINDDRTELIQNDFCQFGTRWRKRTWFLAGNLDVCDLQRLRKQCCGTGGVCSRTKRPHLVLTGSSPSGVPWTRIAQPYPRKLCSILAWILTEPARVHHCNRSWVAIS